LQALWEAQYFGNLSHIGTSDPDGDGFSNAQEQSAGSNPNLAASVPGNIDGDGLPDAWEMLYFNSLNHGPGDDPDADGFNNAAEFAAGSNPTVAASTPNDVDGDGLPDAWEILYFGSLNQTAGNDPDGDTYNNAAEFAAGSNPNLAKSTPADMDADGLPDTWEMLHFGNLAQTRSADPDGDGFSNGAEYAGGTSPTNASAFPAPAGAVSNNIGGNGSLAATEAAGINARTNWNDVTNIVNPGFRLAKNSAGSVVPGMFFSATGRNNSFNSTGTANKKMMSSWMEVPTINLTGIPYSSYKIIVYYDSNAQVSVGNSSVMSFALRSGGTSLSTLYGVNKKAFRLEPNVNPNWDRFQATTLTAANAEVVSGDGGFHLIFEGLTARDLTLQVATISGTPAGISGIEIVYNENFLDEDSDGLPDAWEIATFGNLNQGASADTDLDGLPDAWEQNIVDTFGSIQSVASVQPWDDQDRDGLNNRQEYDGGTNPAVGNSIPANWMVEHWDGIALDGVASLVLEDKFYDPADRWHLASTNSFVDMVATAGVRMRGKIVAPQTGYYHFWLSCRNGGELWLSDNTTKFRKRKIAELSPEVGSGYGITPQNANRWDQYATQMSKPVYLVAGQSYYMEILNQNGHADNRHASVAWARPGAAREPMPVSVLSSYAPEAADRDDDSLLDSWETQHGLNPNDNGKSDPAREGERGDFDGDGLSNREEFILGTNPANADSDSDGISDRDEVRSFGTNPNVSDAPAENVVNTVALGSVVSSVGNWSMVSSGLISNAFRGSVEWNFTVPSAGDWIIHVETGLMGTLRNEEIMDVEAKIDGTFLTRRALIYGPDRSNLLRLVVPGLSAGTHRIALNFDNFIGRRTVVIKKVEVRQPSGIDANSDGRIDWVAAEMALLNHVVPHAATSPTSPMCLEGNSNARSTIMVNGVAATAGSDTRHWFRNLTLNSTGTATSYAVTSGNGFQAAGAVTWSPTNVLDTPEITIRRGDSLRLGAWIANGTGTATINVSGTNLAVSGTGSVVRAFSTGGSFTVTATHSSGLVKTMIVKVRFATLPKGKLVMANSVYKYRVTTTQAFRGLFFDGGKDLRLGLITDVSATNYDLVLYPEWGGTYGLLARLYEGGPILDVAPIFGISASDALQNELTTATTAPGQPGFVILTTPIVVKNIPPGGRVVIDIARAGVTFLDGTKQKIFYAADFQNDLIVLQFLAPADLSGGYCHTLKVQDANGATVQ